MKSPRSPLVRFMTCLTGLGICLLPGGGSDVLAQENPSSESPAASPLDQIVWNEGPGTARLGDVAEIQFPEGYVFTGPDGARSFLEANENPRGGDELGLLIHPLEDDLWFAIFSFDAIGYVKDDEKDKLDPDGLLESIREGTAEANKERVKRGWTPVDIVGWEQAPNYNSQTNRLEWAIRARSGDGDGESVNFSTRLLGRGGVMRVQLVSSPERLGTSIAEFQSVLGGFGFRSGHKYAEFRQGDAIAKYGLTALIAGGVGAAAAKSGLLGKFFKFIVIGVIGLLGAARQLFARKPSTTNVSQG
jgi:uncharacterized membrane-anchored protein